MVRFNRKWFGVIALVVAVAIISGVVISGRFGRGSKANIASDNAPASASAPADKVILSDPAQKNLKLTAKPVKVETFWKTITVLGMVVDRPGVSDREVVAPAVGTIVRILHTPGDIIRPGEVLFTLKLASESFSESQANLFKATQDTELARAQLKRLKAGGEGIAQSKIVEVENEIKRQESAAKSFRLELASRGLTPEEIEGIASGRLVTELSVVAPPQAGNKQTSHDIKPESTDPTTESTSPTYELQGLKVKLGEQVQAGQTLCHLANHQLLAIEGQAFRDETTLVERSMKSGWSVEVDFQEAADADWPAIERSYPIQYIANTIDATTRTFAFLMPLANQSKSVEQDNRQRLLWRFRPGQKVLIRVRVEQMDNVFVLPADAVVPDGAEAFVFTQNVNTFERKSVHVLLRDRDRVVVANDGSLPVYPKGNERWTLAAVVRSAAAQLNRMTKAGSNEIPKGYHVHADGSLHKNEDEGK